ncbi:MAG: alpha/beta hydrolase [Chloroflexota bacterium]
MPSFKSQLLYFLMKNRHLLRGRLRAPVWDMNTSIEDFRRQAEGTTRALTQPVEGVRAERLTVCGLPAEWLIPENEIPRRAILYAIGGGYVSGSCNDHRAMISKLARGSRVRVLLLEHRLAPEHRFPAPVEDMLAGYQWLLEQGYQAAQLQLAGESAGGGLALAALLALRDRGLPLPAAAAVMSPFTDLALTGESHVTRARQCLSPRGMSEVCVRHYLGDQDPRHPWASPLYGDLRGLPPLLIYVGDYETLRDDATRFAAKAQAAGMDVTLRIGAQMIHCYPLLAPMFPEATQALDEICEFIRKHT